MPRLPFVVALVGGLASVLLAFWVWGTTVEAAEAEVRNVGDLLVESIADAVDGVADQLVAVAGLYHSSEDVARIEFARFVKNLGVDAGVAGIAYAPVLEADEIDEFEAEVGRVVDGYEVFEYASDGSQVPVPSRERYVPLQWSHPDTPFDRPYGFDLASVPALETTMTESATLMSAVATPFMQLPGESDADSFLVFWPVTHTDAPTLRGYTVALVDLSDFLDAHLPLALSETVSWQVFDSSSELDLPDAWSIHSLEVLGEEWDLAVTGIDGRATTPSPTTALIALFAGLAATLAVVVGVVAYRQRAQARRELERLRELGMAKDQFLASVGHELRTPLTGVVGFTALLRDPDSGLTDAEREKMIESIANESSDLAAIIDDLLVAARSELDLVTVTAEPVAMPRLVADVVAAVRDDKASSIDVVAEGAGGIALGDPARIRQVIRNLVSNACRYGSEPIQARVVEDGGLVVAQVVDHGPGVPVEEWERIFEPYHRVHRVETKPAALGIGLSVSRHLSRLMGGDLTYRHDGERSIFELRLPTAGLALDAVPAGDTRAEGEL